ncbi:restriction endonuclease subunit S [Thiothrix subterranea]|uniref:restriction endonuclease subunit S n=1 Tax=Thiothrix subterranea TaxID=2735563 RepID=UPI00192A9EF7|nr:restriction endonuclease subunit S [Thiothrix subterranea]QQZ29279.1 restriction endonuclease subunit S [Thiothrix subterranea]
MKKYVRLNDLGYVSRGRSQHRPRNAPHLYDGKYPFIQTADITKSDLYITSYSQTYTEAGLSQSRLWDAGTLCIANAGVNTGDNAILGFKACFPDSVIGFIADKSKCNVLFVKYYLDVIKPQIKSITMGATQDNLSVSKLLTFDIPNVSLEIQNKIAGILSAYDDLIENNNRRIALLENMAEELYREWFVRFRFPGWREAEFEKGIPKGWELQRVDSLGKIITGKTPLTSNEKYYLGNIHFIKTPDMHGNMFIYETEEKLTEDGLKSQPSQILPKNAISVSCIGTGGITSITTQRCCTNQQINSIVLKNENDLEWAFYTVKGLKETIYAFGSTGTTMTNLSKGKFSGLKFICVPKYLRDEYHMLTCPMFKEIQRLTQINNMLAKTKNALLPRLISGKLAVEDLAVQLPPSMHPKIA